MKIKEYFILAIILLPVVSEAQTSWKRYRYETIFGIGAANLLGDLGGADQIGTQYFRDLEIVATRPAITAGMRYRLTPRTSVKANLTWGMLYGNDELTNEQFRNPRDLHFRTHIVEFSSTYEFYFIEDRGGHRFKLRGVKGIRAKGVHPYGFFGLAGFWFNPQAKFLDGNWYALRPLGTEGQNASETRKPYSRVQFAVPIGFGSKFNLSNRRWLVGFEFGMRKTWTDYIDDVSTTYFPNRLIQQQSPQYGPQAAYFANSSGWFGGGPFQQRGNPTNYDSYMFLMISANYTLKTTRGGLPKFRD